MTTSVEFAAPNQEIFEKSEQLAKDVFEFMASKQLGLTYQHMALEMCLGNIIIQVDDVESRQQVFQATVLNINNLVENHFKQESEQ